MKNTYTRFTAGLAVLTVYLRVGKKGLNVAASLKKPGEKAVPGARETFVETDPVSEPSAEQRALVYFTKLKTDAIGNGWTEKVKPVKKDRVKKDRNAFVTIPAASDMPQADPTVAIDIEPANIADVPVAAKASRKKVAA